MDIDHVNSALKRAIQQRDEARADVKERAIAYEQGSKELHDLCDIYQADTEELRNENRRLREQIQIHRAKYYHIGQQYRELRGRYQ